jgi:coenzyme PQQ synthesis protein D (PqqD)
MIADTTVFALGEGISYQPLGAGEGAVVLTVSSGQLYTCNDTTAAFLDLVDGSRTFVDLVDGLHETFEVPHAELQRDLGALAADLMAEGIIRAQ